MITINELLKEHVTLTVDSLDRLYLNGYVPRLQTPGQLVTFLRDHRKNPIPSPALLGRITARFKEAVEAFARQRGLEIVHFRRGERKDDVAAKQRKGFKPPEGVYLIGVAQEKCTAFKSAKRVDRGRGRVGFDYSPQSVCVNHYYFYLVDKDFDPAFTGITVNVIFCDLVLSFVITVTYSEKHTVETLHFVQSDRQCHFLRFARGQALRVARELALERSEGTGLSHAFGMAKNLQ